jgi:AmmeMemoRadiSam system protein B
MIRPPAVAGRFYPQEAEELARQVRSFCERAESGARSPAIACLVPHAGYRYSGAVAGAVYARIELPQRFVLLGPRHFPRGASQAILSEGSWETPLGMAEIDAGLATEIMRACETLREDPVAHHSEHALEVQLPFLQKLAPGFQFVPIALGTVDFAPLERLGNAIAEVLLRRAAAGEEPVLLVASSDMNHYEADDITRVKDRMAIERIVALDARGLYDTVRRENISMCGFGPAMAMLAAANVLGATSAELVRYATSADAGGDRDEVVGYAGMIVR